MKILKHFKKVLTAYVIRLNCKHVDSHSASCPFTGLTYTTCNKCLKKVKVEVTNG